MALLVYFPAIYSEDYATNHAETLACLMLIALHLVQAFLSRSLETSLFRMRIFGNRWLVGAVALSFALLCAGSYIPGVNTFFGFVPLEAEDWGKIAAGATALVLYSEFIKFLLRRRRRWLLRKHVNPDRWRISWRLWRRHRPESFESMPSDANSEGAAHQ